MEPGFFRMVRIVDLFSSEFINQKGERIGIALKTILPEN